MIIVNTRLLVAILLSLVLTIIPLPEVMTQFRPPWVLLMILYIQFWLPDYFRVIWIFLLGLCLDTLLATTIGEHSFALLLTLWLAASKTRRFHFFSTIQQMILVFGFCLIYECILYLIDASFHYNNGVLFIAVSAFTGMLFWPWLKLIADNLFIKRSSS